MNNGTKLAIAAGLLVLGSSDWVSAAEPAQPTWTVGAWRDVCGVEALSAAEDPDRLGTECYARFTGLVDGLLWFPHAKETETAALIGGMVDGLGMTGTYEFFSFIVNGVERNEETDEMYVWDVLKGIATAARLQAAETAKQQAEREWLKAKAEADNAWY